MRTIASYTLDEAERFRDGLLQWAARFEVFVCLNSHGHLDPYGDFDMLLAADPIDQVAASLEKGAFEQLHAALSRQKDWFFGYLSYDLKNDLEPLTSANPSGLNFPALYFFRPKRIIRLRGKQVDFLYSEGSAHEIEDDFRQIGKAGETPAGTAGALLAGGRIRSRMSREAYRDAVGQLHGHINRGDIYEANLCLEYFADQTQIDPFQTYRNLSRKTESPFSSLMKAPAGWVISASPERYLRKKGGLLIAQPMKGTAARSPDPEIDRRLKLALETDPKERSENIMIADLVRNDLSKRATRGSVRVAELCRVYGYRQAHQMVTTVLAEVPPDTPPVLLIRDSFPMGSMTGAPKVSAMKILEKVERSRRGVYSGALGYISPEGDFDFSVVIRSILYDPVAQHVSFSVGSAITAGSRAESEYKECLLKARALRDVLSKGHS